MPSSLPFANHINEIFAGEGVNPKSQIVIPHLNNGALVRYLFIWYPEASLLAYSSQLLPDDIEDLTIVWRAKLKKNDRATWGGRVIDIHGNVSFLSIFPGNLHKSPLALLEPPASSITELDRWIDHVFYAWLQPEGSLVLFCQDREYLESKYSPQVVRVYEAEAESSSPYRQYAIFKQMPHTAAPEIIKLTGTFNEAIEIEEA